jgi:Zn-dependent protease with chaperone function
MTNAAVRREISLDWRVALVTVRSSVREARCLGSLVNGESIGGVEFDFVAMLQQHRRARQRAGVLAAFAGVVGVAVALVAWRWFSAQPLWTWIGLLVTALAVVPLREALDRSDRIQALERLRGAWAQAVARSGSATELGTLRRMIRETHGVAGGS